MARNMNFSATLKLNSEQFKKGVKDIQRSISGLKSSFMQFAGALGAGLGFSQLSRSIMDTANKLSVAKNVLENVSVGWKEYGENISWLKDISNKYGQDMVVLINEFSQFRAAAKDSGLEIDKLRDIYESLTRAAGAYHMSSQRTQDMMIAVTQMFSKGKVTAEELRRQLGNSLPGAFNLMAKAAGMAGVTVNGTTAELEKAMRDGKVLAKDVLPTFATVLNQATQGADFNSLQTSLNKLKNSWIKFVDEGKFEGKLKWLVDVTSKTLDKIASNFKHFRFNITSILMGIFGVKLSKNAIMFTDELAKKWDDANDKVKKYDNKVTEVAKKIKFGCTFLDSPKAQKYGLNAYSFNLEGKDSDIKSYIKNLDNLRKSYEKLIEVNKELTVKDKDILTNKLSKVKSKEAKAIEAYANQKAISNENVITSLKLGITEQELKEGKAYANNLNLINKLFLRGKIAAYAFGTAVKTALSSIGIGLLIAGITELIQLIWNAISEAKKLKNYTKDVISEMEKNAGTASPELVDLTYYRDALKTIKENSDGTANSLKGHQTLLDKINKQMGLIEDKSYTEESNIDDIINKCDDWIAKLKEVAKQQATINALKEQYAKQIEVEAAIEILKKDPRYKQTMKYIYGGKVYDSGQETGKSYSIGRKIDKNIKLLEQINKAIYELLNYPNSYENDPNFVGPIRRPYADEDNIISPNPEKTEIGKMLDDLSIEEKKLSRQKQYGAITAEEYSKELDKLREKTYKSIAAFGDWKKIIDKLSKEDLSKLYSLKGQVKKIQIVDILDETMKDIESKIDKDAELIDKKIEDWADKWAKSISKIFELSNELNRLRFSNKIERKTTYDYMFSSNKEKGKTYSELEIETIKGNLDLKLENIEGFEKLKSEIDESISNGTITEEFRGQALQILNEVTDKIKELKKEATEAQHIINLSEIEDNIKSTTEELKNNAWSGLNDVADSADRLSRSIKKIKETMEDTDATTFEKFITIFNTLIQLADTLSSAFKGVSDVIKLVGDIAELSAKKEAAANAIAAKSEIDKAAASTAAAGAGAASSVAGIPIVGPVLAIGAVAAVLAAIMSTTGKFANGGIINYGTTSGDKTLARVNRGEGILTANGVKNLQSIYNSKGMGGDVQFKIKGDQLVGVLNNYNLKRRG